MRWLGRYRIVKELAHGRMGHAFLAQRDDGPELCVLKQMRPELAEHAIGIQRRVREAASLVHPNIAAIRDAGFRGDMFCVAYELVRGVDLERIQRPARPGKILPLPLTLGIARQLLDGVSAVHQATGTDGARRRLVHGELAPRNLMVDVDGNVKIIDLGFAHARVDLLSTEPGLGTLRYLSPEQARGEPVDHRSDLYTVAVVIFELVTGQPLVAGPNHPAPRARTLNPDLPPALEEVLSVALEKDAAKRFESASALRDALLRACPEIIPGSSAAIASYIRATFPKVVDEHRRWAQEARERWEVFSTSTLAREDSQPARTELSCEPASRRGTLPRVRDEFIDIKSAEIEAVELAADMVQATHIRRDQRKVRSQSIELGRAPKPNRIGRDLLMMLAGGAMVAAATAISFASSPNPFAELARSMTAPAAASVASNVRQAAKKPLAALEIATRPEPLRSRAAPKVARPATTASSTGASTAGDVAQDRASAIHQDIARFEASPGDTELFANIKAAIVSGAGDDSHVLSLLRKAEYTADASERCEFLRKAFARLVELSRGHLEPHTTRESS